jgi:broad specificity phosphatase PhoE
VTTFYLIRHGSNDYLGRALAARLPNVGLNEAGQAEAERVTRHLQSQPIRHVLSSPMQRCRETAEPLAKALGLQIEISDAINEVDFGDWQGAELKALDADERWKKWNSFRSGHALPRGETVVAIQARVAGEMIRLAKQFAGEHVALCSHGDPIRAALCYWLGMPLDFLQRLEVDPGSISEVALGGDTAVVRRINWF